MNALGKPRNQVEVAYARTLAKIDAYSKSLGVDGPADSSVVIPPELASEGRPLGALLPAWDSHDLTDEQHAPLDQATLFSLTGKMPPRKERHHYYFDGS